MRTPESLAVRPAIRLSQPVVIGHRGAPAYRPEHTTASYELAIDLGAELIEPDVVVSRDGALVVRHESELSWSTDVATRSEFVGRRTTKIVEGAPSTGWFAEDFTLAELKHPGWTPDGPDLPMAELVTEELRRLEASDAAGPVVLQSFDPAVLRDLRARLGDDGPEMVQLVDDIAEGDRMVTPAGLREISTYAQAVGPSRDRILFSDDQLVTGTSDLVDEAHRAALSVFCWTLRAENAFLPAHLRRGDAPGAHGDALGEARLLLDLGVDGLISDAPDHAVRAIAELAAV